MIDFMSRARIATAAVTATVAVALTGCTAAGSVGSVELDVMLWGTAEDIQSIKAAAAGFSEDNPDVAVNFVTGDCAASYSACKQLIAAGGMPDVVVPGSWNYDAMARDGILADVTTALEESGATEADFVPAALEVVKTDGDELFGLPMGYNIQSMWFNQDMFDAAKLAYPDPNGDYTWNDVRDWARLLTLDANGNNASSPEFDPNSITQYGMHFGVTDQWPNIIARSFGGAVLGGRNYDECELENPKTIRALDFVQGMMFDDRTAITQQLNTEEPGYQRWVTGSVAMEIGSNEQSTLANTQNPDMRYDTAALPAGDAGHVTLLQEHIWSAYAGSDQLETASRFVVYMATAGAGRQMGLIPAYKDLAETTFLQDEKTPEHIIEGQLTPSTWPGLFANVDPRGIRDAVAGQDGYGQALTDIFTGAKPAEVAVEGICAAVDTAAGN